MKKKTINKAVKTINRKIKVYQLKLTEQLEQRAESELNDGKTEVISKYERKIKKYEIILADLSMIKRAIKNNETSVRIYGTYDIDISAILKKAGFLIDSDGVGNFDLIPIEEWREECDDGTSCDGYDPMLMQGDGLMEMFEN